jgi:formylglycine-generating enzyme required for sulfatase activity
MRPRILPLLVILLLFASFLLPPPVARTQERGPGGGTAPVGASGYHALVIGNNNYASLPKLKTAEADAREVAALLKEFYGFDTRLLLNATRQQIVTALFSYRQALGPDANLLVYYAGHGINDTQAEKSYWLPVDATRDDDSNWISADDITTRIRAIPARHVLVISDSCYSGTLTRGLGEALPPPNAREQFLQRMMSGRSRTLMASGGNEPVADGGGGRHSVFASALMRGLREIDRPRFTAAELFRFYVEEPVAGRAQQTPEYNPLRNSGHESGDFVFVKPEGGTIPKTAPAATGRPAGPVEAPAAARSAAGAVLRNKLGMELVYVPPGDFLMGSENGGPGEKPVHRVTIREGFYMGRHEVTQAQWHALMGGAFSGCDDCPVERVTWNEVQSFIQKLNELGDGFLYRLPSEAEWEYACRAGSARDTAGYLDALAWYDANSGRRTHPVGQKQPNAFGLYDMHGNVWEWVQDYWHPNYDGAPADGSAWLSGGDTTKRVMRGGSWFNDDRQLRSAQRSGRPPGLRVNTVGFRLVAVPK